MIKHFSLLLFTMVCMVFTSAAFADYPFKDLAGEDRRLDQYVKKQDKWTVAMIWASDCHVCNVEAEQYTQFHENNKQKNIQMLGISTDGQKKFAAARAFVERHDITFPNIVGEFETVATMYQEMTGNGWIGTPTIMVFNPAGELKAATAGAVPPELIEDYIAKQTLAAKPAGNSTK